MYSLVVSNLEIPHLWLGSFHHWDGDKITVTGGQSRRNGEVLVHVCY